MRVYSPHLKLLHRQCRGPLCKLISCSIHDSAPENHPKFHKKIPCHNYLALHKPDNCRWWSGTWKYHFKKHIFLNCHNYWLSGSCRKAQTSVSMLSYTACHKRIFIFTSTDTDVINKIIMLDRSRPAHQVKLPIWFHPSKVTVSTRLNNK